MTLAPLVTGALMEDEKYNTDNYFYTYLFFMGVLIISLVFAFYIVIYDKKTGNRLNMIELDYN